MKSKALMLLAALAVFVAPVHAQVSKDCGYVTACSLSLPSVSAGDRTVLVVRVGSIQTITVSGFQLIGQVDSPDPHRLAVFSQISAGPVTIAVSIPAASTIRMAAASFSGPWDATKLPAFIGAIGTGLAAASGACDSAAALCAGGISTANAATPTALTGETIIASAGNKVFMLTGSAASQAKLATSDMWAAVVASFYRPPPPPPSLLLNVNLLWDDRTAITVVGALQLNQMIGTVNTTLTVYPLAGTGTSTAPLTVDLTQSDPLEIQFLTLDTNGKTTGSLVEWLPKSLFLNRTKAVATLTVSKTDLGITGFAWASQ